MQVGKIMTQVCLVAALTGVLVVPARAADEKAPAPAAPENPAAQSLGKTIRVEFKLRPAGKDNQDISITTALPWFGAKGNFKSKEGKLAFEVSGNVTVFDDHNLFLKYDLKVDAAGKPGEAAFQSHGSALLQSGEALSAITVGDKTLIIRASVVDEKPANAADKSGKPKAGKAAATPPKGE